MKIDYAEMINRADEQINQAIEYVLKSNTPVQDKVAAYSLIFQAISDNNLGNFPCLKNLETALDKIFAEQKAINETLSKSLELINKELKLVIDRLQSGKPLN